ncbi:MAG: sialate O-acetylesterase, partial [Planctomycetes bacterium]|nr:sialate O-acetylesterase [Planctomycetota bacterium]
GDHYKEQVLLIKTAWGGKSIYKDFRPPSSGGEVGPFYTQMVDHVHNVLANLKTEFPGYDESKGYEICGFLWFQGFNDQFDPNAVSSYEENMANLIKDLRKEFKVPKMPVVIGALGTGGKKGPIAEAQEAAANRAEFKGTAAFVETAQHWDHEADKMCSEGVWKGPDKAKFYRIAAERPYHYLGSGKMMFLMGHDFGEAMVELLKK